MICVSFYQVKVEDAGFDWKILGPDVQEEDYVAHTCDQDAYAYRCAQIPILKIISDEIKFEGTQ